MQEMAKKLTDQIWILYGYAGLIKGPDDDSELGLNKTEASGLALGLERAAQNIAEVRDELESNKSAPQDVAAS